MFPIGGCAACEEVIVPAQVLIAVLDASTSSGMTRACIERSKLVAMRVHLRVLKDKKDLTVARADRASKKLAARKV